MKVRKDPQRASLQTNLSAPRHTANVLIHLLIYLFEQKHLIYHIFLYRPQKTFHVALRRGDVSSGRFLPANISDQPLKGFLPVYHFQMGHLSLCAREKYSSGARCFLCTNTVESPPPPPPPHPPGTPTSPQLRLRVSSAPSSREAKSA